jgi:multiple sugar transport system substrate-binding protein
MSNPVSRRTFLRGSAATVAGLGALWLAACAAPVAAPQTGTESGAAPAAASGEPVPALLRSDAEEQAYFDRCLALFAEKNPDVPVNPIYVPGGADYNTKLDLMVASGDPPAIYAPFSDRGYRYYASKGLSQPLDDFVAADNMDLTDFQQDGLKGCYWNGELMALPLDLWPHLIYFNRNIFDEAGVPYPGTDWEDKTWNTDSYRALAESLTKRDGDKVTQFGSDIYFNYWASSWTFGGDILPLDTYETGVVRGFTGNDDPRVPAAIQWNADLFLKDQVAPTPAQATQVQTGVAYYFMTGLIGMGMSNIGRLSTYATIEDFQWGVAPAPFPANGDPRHLHVWIDFWSMIKGVKNLEGAWKLLSFMVSPEAQLIYPIEYGPLSARLSLAEDWIKIQKEKLTNLTDAEFGVIAKGAALEQIDPENWTANFSPINAQALQPALDRVWLGEATAEQAIADATPQIEQLIAETSASIPVQ